jgi:uncharacterized protein (DUF433 family)
MSYQERIIINPEVLLGKPVIKGTRLSVEFIMGLLAAGWPEKEILRNYPGITHEDILGCFEYSSKILKLEKVYPVKKSA